MVPSSVSHKEIHLPSVPAHKLTLSKFTYYQVMTALDLRGAHPFSASDETHDPSHSEIAQCLFYSLAPCLGCQVPTAVFGL